MASPLLSWLEGNWFSLLQAVGIISGLFFTAASIRQGVKARQISDLLALTTQHRELWSELRTNPELSRVVSPSVDLVARPITFAEEQFINLAIVHFHTGFLLVDKGSLVSAKTLARDAKTFFSLPIPRVTWEGSRSGRDPRFVKFVESSVKA